MVKRKVGQKFLSLTNYPWNNRLYMLKIYVRDWTSRKIFMANIIGSLYVRWMLCIITISWIEGLWKEITRWDTMRILGHWIAFTLMFAIIWIIRKTLSAIITIKWTFICMSSLVSLQMPWALNEKVISSEMKTERSESTLIIGYRPYASSVQIRLEYSAFWPCVNERTSRKSILFLSCVSNVCDFTTRKLLNQFNGWYEG